MSARKRAKRTWYAQDAAFLSDPRIEALGEEFGASGPLAIVALLGAAKQQDSEGWPGRATLPWGALRRSCYASDTTATSGILGAAAELGLVEIVELTERQATVRFPRWEEYQYADADAAERQKRWRERQRERDSNVTVTPGDTPRDVPETPTGTSTTTETTTTPSTLLVASEETAAAVARVVALHPQFEEVMALYEATDLSTLDASINAALNAKPALDHVMVANRVISYAANTAGLRVRDAGRLHMTECDKVERSQRAGPRRGGGARANVDSDLRWLEEQRLAAIEREAVG